MKPAILHADIDAFFASVEKLLIPALRDKPVAVGAGVIASCCYLARRYGLHAGQPLSEARRLCPGLVILPGRHAAYHAFAQAIWNILKRFSPDVETQVDDAYLDLTGLEHIHRGLERAACMLRRMVREETGLAVTVGGGSSRTIARLAGKTAKPDGMRIVQPDDVLDFLAPLPVEILTGVGHRTETTLHKLGIRTIADLQALSRKQLALLFGRNGEVLYERARGRDADAPAIRQKPPKTVSRQTTLGTETTDSDEIRGMLFYLADRAVKALRERRLAAGTVKVTLRYLDFDGAEAATELPLPSDTVWAIFEKACGLLERISSRRVAVRLVGISLCRLVPKERTRMPLWEPHTAERRERLATALDTIRDRFGFSSILVGPSIMLNTKLKKERGGFILRTPCLTK